MPPRAARAGLVARTQAVAFPVQRWAEREEAGARASGSRARLCPAPANPILGEVAVQAAPAEAEPASTPKEAGALAEGGAEAEAVQRLLRLVNPMCSWATQLAVVAAEVARATEARLVEARAQAGEAAGEREQTCWTT